MKQGTQIVFIAVLILAGAGLVLTREQLNTQQQADKLLVATQRQESPEVLAKESGCLECHSVDKDIVGPSYRAVAERYKGDDNARAALIEKVKRGGSGNWAKVTRGVPMPPYGRRLSAAEIARLVDWVLAQ